MSIKPYSERHTTDDLFDSLRITISSKKQWFQILFIGFWLVGWASGELFAARVLIDGIGFGGIDLFIIAWLGMWTIGGGFALYTLLWQLLGRETILVSSSGVTTSRSILGLSLFHKKYASKYIKDLRVSASISSNYIYGWSRSSRFYGLGGGLIAFDYGAKTMTFGIGIDEAEAKQILLKIQQRYPQYRSKMVLNELRS